MKFNETRNSVFRMGKSKKYPDQVEYVMAMEEMELFDVDTKEDLELLLRGQKQGHQEQ